MDPDKILINWYRDNQLVLAKNNVDGLDDVVSYFGWPSESKFQPYWEELQHVLNDGVEELGVSLPDELIQYYLSKWMGADVPIDHPLVQDREKWLKIFYDDEYDMAKPVDAKQLFLLVYNTAGPRLKENLASYEDVVVHHNSPDITGKTYMTNIGGQIIRLVTGADVVAFMDSDGQIKVFDYSGNRMYEGEDLPKVQNYLLGAPFGGGIDNSELASVIGNDLADRLIGRDGVGLLDLP